MFCFAWPFHFIPGIYKYSLDKLISHIDCVVAQSPKSQNNGLMGPFSLQRAVQVMMQRRRNQLIERRDFCFVSDQKDRPNKVKGAYQIVAPTSRSWYGHMHLSYLSSSQMPFVDEIRCKRR